MSDDPEINEYVKQKFAEWTRLEEIKRRLEALEFPGVKTETEEKP